MIISHPFSFELLPRDPFCNSHGKNTKKRKTITVCLVFSLRIMSKTLIKATFFHVREQLKDDVKVTKV